MSNSWSIWVSGSLMSLPAKMTKNQVWASVCVYYILYILKNCCGIFCEKVRISDFLDLHSAVYVPHTNMHSICTFFYKCRPTICHVVHESGLRSLLMHSKTYKLSGRACPWTPLEYVVGSTCLLTLKLPVLGTKKIRERFSLFPDTCHSEALPKFGILSQAIACA